MCCTSSSKRRLEGGKTSNMLPNRNNTARNRKKYNSVPALRTNRPTRGTEDPTFIGRQHSMDNTTGRSADEENANKNGRKSKIVACVLRAPHNDLQRGRVRSAAAQRNSPEQPKNRCSCHVSCQLACDARRCDDRYAAAPAQQLDDEVEGAEDLGPGSAFRAEQSLSPRRAQLTTATKAIMMQAKSSSAASPFSNLMVS